MSVIEIGGTIGDFQNALFIEAARVLKMKHPEDVLFVMVSYLPTPGTLGEMKTKPTQTAVRDLNSYGIQPDFIVARSKEPVDEKRKDKLAISCNVPHDHIISAPDIDSIYEAPLNFEKDKLGDQLLDALALPEKRRASLAAWKKFSLAAADKRRRRRSTSPSSENILIQAILFLPTPISRSLRQLSSPRRSWDAARRSRG